MQDTDQKLEDDVLRRMLATKPKPHKPKGKKGAAKVVKLRHSLERPDFQKLEMDTPR